MKKFKQIMLSVLCICVMLGTTACGSRTDTNDAVPNDTNMNDATEGDHNAPMEDGSVDDIGDAVGEGLNDIGTGIEDFADDMTEDRK